MNTRLLPNYFKKIGLIILFFGLIAGFLTYGIDDAIKGFKDADINSSGGEKMEANSSLQEHNHFGVNWGESWIRLFDLCFIGGMLIYSVSREKTEDELFRTLRFEAAWATLVVFLAITFIRYASSSNIEFELWYILGFPLVLYLIIFHFKKKSFAQ